MRSWSQAAHAGQIGPLRFQIVTPRLLLRRHDVHVAASTSDSKSRSTRPSDVLGAVGLPIAILALLISWVPVAGILYFWAPGGVGVILGALGMWINREERDSQLLSRLSLGFGLGSFAVTGVWLLIGMMIAAFIDAASECFTCY